MKRFLYLAAFVLLAFAGGALLQAAQTAQPGAGRTPAPDLSGYPWLYLRDGVPLAAEESVVELIAVGDVMLGRGVAAETAPFAAAAAWLQQADVVLGNLESVIVAGGTPRSAPVAAPQPYILHAPPTAVSQLHDAGFDVLGLANNHALDFGGTGLAQTAVHLQKEGIAVVGAGPTETAALQPLCQQVGSLAIAFLAFNAVSDPGGTVPAQAGDSWLRADWAPVTATAAVAAARAGADAVVVSVHWGYEYDLHAAPAQQKMAQALLEAGADLVVGHHPHVVQEMAVADGRFIAYSLGNFVFDQGQGETGQGLALRAFFDKEGLRAVQALPLWAGLRPHLMAPEAAAPLLARIEPPPRRTGFACDGQTCREVAVAPTAADGLFWGGEIDLTGDGVAEKVRRAGERVSVYEEGTAVWQSPPSWRVVDVALGDPNDDGRGELVLAIYQKDPQGYERSQPYVVGYRGGEYKLMWGGRPVQDPIQEIELGDVDGDGIQELVVLETSDDGGRAIAVWRWQGWSFGLLWRSESGPYRDLVLRPDTAVARSILSVTLDPQK